MTCARITMDDPRYDGERDLRNRVLLRPIGLPDHAWEMHDRDAFHFVAVEDGKVVGCVVLHPSPETPGSARLMQMAVEPALQKRGIGTELVRRLMAFAEAKGYAEVCCHSRESAVAFYRRLGFEEYAAPFVEVGVLHRHMRRRVGSIAGRGRGANGTTAS